MQSIQKLLEQHVTVPGLHLGADIDPRTLHAAVADLGFGLEHLTGERPIAVMPGAIVTDRRILWLSGDRPYAARLDQLSPSMVPHELAMFVGAIAAVPPDERVAPARPIVTPLPSDPTGALGALGELHQARGVDDARAEQLLCLVEASVRRGTGMDSVAGADLAARAVLLDRTITTGRGSHLSFWVSPLTVADFAHAATLVLGAPHQRWLDPQGFVSLTFRSDGVNVHVRIVPIGAHAGFAIQATTGASHQSLPKSEERRITRFVHAALHAYESQILLLRTMYGWTRDVADLLRASPEAVAERMRDLVGWCELSAFLPAAQAMDAFEGHTDSAMPAELAMTPDERVAGARIAWDRALAGGELAAMMDAAQRLQQAQAWEDAAQAYSLVGERFAEVRAEAAAGAGDCILFSVYARTGAPREDRVDVLQMALAWYDSALRYGCARERVEESYWSACELLLAANEGNRLRQLEALARYQSTFPDGNYRDDANVKLASLSV